MDLANFVVLVWLYIAVHSSHASDGCFGNPDYICDDKSSKRSCECKDGDTCYFKLVLEDKEKDMNNQMDKIITVNGLFQGPTLIIKFHDTVVVDVVNNMKEETSIHWHGMHQINVPWMDGVGYITQWAIQPGRKFRYIFQAQPGGSFWYHSHVGTQRSRGLFGSLIVRETDVPQFPGIVKFEDNPAEHTLVFLDFERNTVASGGSPSVASGGPPNKKKLCYPDGSNVPPQESSSVPVLNGIELPDNGPKAARRRRSASSSHPQISTFFVELNKIYRFRLIGAMESAAYRFSIDDHKLIVVATDGYLLEPFETDYIIIHSGERYDFLLEANQNNSVWFLMRIETLAIDCISKRPLKASGLALLGYDDSPSDEFLENCNSNDPNPRGCNEDAPCYVVNCPFKDYNQSVHLDCQNVDKLRLLHETPARDIPDSENIVLQRTWFYDFEIASEGALINGVKFQLPNQALQVSNYHGKINDCGYNNCTGSLSNPDYCVHIVNIPDEYYKTSMRFVLSSLGGRKTVFTHPIHLHGHSFHVVKIGYPSYHPENGTIKERTQDLESRGDECGPASWKNNCVPDEMIATSKTVRKDTIMVPGGGYVVIEFRADNPGYWFMHCHIDPHLAAGMAVAIRELEGYQNPPPANLTVNNTDFCWTVDEFKKQNNFLDPCNATQGAKEHDQPCFDTDKPVSKGRQAEFVKKTINRSRGKNMESVIEKEPILKDQPGSRISWNDRRAWRLQKGESTSYEDQWERRFRQKFHSSKKRPFLSDGTSVFARKAQVNKSGHETNEVHI